MVVYPDSDFILRTKDGVDIHVHKQVLRDASQTFRSILSIPTPSDVVPEPLLIDDVSADVLPLIQYFYGHSLFHLRFHLLEEIIALHKVATKYVIEEMESLLLKEIKERLPITDDPVRAWALASHYGSTREKILAAQAFFMSDDRCSQECMDLKELEYVSGRELGDLLSTRRRVHEQARELFIDIFWNCRTCDDIDIMMESYDDPDQDVYARTSRDVWRSLSEVKDGSVFDRAVMHPAVMTLCATESECPTCLERYGRELKRTPPTDLYPLFLIEVRRQIPELKVYAACYSCKLSKN